MIPSIDDRLASVVRALTEVILPHLPPEASLAKEQAQLCIGHLQILRAQIDAAPAFEREELADAITLARALSTTTTGHEKARIAMAAALDRAGAVDGHNAAEVREHCHAVNQASEALIAAVSAHGDAAEMANLTALVIGHEQSRVQKDRLWCAPFGFDTL